MGEGLARLRCAGCLPLCRGPVWKEGSEGGARSDGSC